MNKTNISKKNCVNCHFLMKTVFPENGNPSPLELKKKDRNLILKDAFNWEKDNCSLDCSFLVWDEGFNKQKSFLKP